MNVIRYSSKYSLHIESDESVKFTPVGFQQFRRPSTVAMLETYFIDVEKSSPSEGYLP